MSRGLGGNLRDEHPVLEIGGTHVTAAMVVLAPRPTVQDALRLPIDPHASANILLATFAEAGRRLNAAPGSRWGVALPGPFDYASGIGRYRGVGKLDGLNGVDVGRALHQRLAPAVDHLTFINDANAFLLGEHVAGAARGEPRVIALTLGTGVGSAFLDQGRIIETGPRVPAEGRVDLLRHRGAPLEETFSRRAIMAAYEGAAGLAGRGEPAPDVLDITALARHGDQTALTVLTHASFALATCVAPWVQRFRATSLVIGGSMARSWDVLRPGFVSGLDAGGSPLSSLRIATAQHLDDAPLIGAAWHAAHVTDGD